MKNILFHMVALTISLSACKGDYSKMEGRPSIVAVHRCNEIEKLMTTIDDGINDFEVDIHIQTIDGIPTLMVGHEVETATGLTFVEYIDSLMSIKPDFHFLWLDMKDLKNVENESATYEVLNMLDSKYSIKSRVLVESQHIQHLTTLANEGWSVSFFCSYWNLTGKKAKEQAAICAEWLQSMQTYNVDCISFEATAYRKIKEHFEGKAVNGRIVKQCAWDTSLSFLTPDIDKQLGKYAHLSTLLVELDETTTYKQTLIQRFRSIIKRMF